MSEREHGTYVKYKLDGCRCYPCGFAESQYSRNRERAIAYGRWQPYVDAEPVRQHVRALGEFGIGWKRAARLAGVSTGCVSKLLYGDGVRHMSPSKGVRRETAERLLAVEPTLDNLGSAVLMDATGTRRRLQALVAAGWPQARLAVRLNMEPGNFSALIRRAQVTVRVVRQVVDLYEALWRVDPREHGVDNQAYNRARNAAADQCWAPAGTWDDDRIDDPSAFPDWTGMCGTPQGRAIHYRIGISPCQPCRAAAARERQQKKEANVA
ncbi:hypothetical protein [Streptomyces vilmorinianum]|uniref:hypothetical protein n=1 Tax=Streptomyces vilmorinianum TaxID=3051092 RepID=UPI0010FADCF5|nr:hypothetical protein [Streptomyces vilmorinianum]